MRILLIPGFLCPKSIWEDQARFSTNTIDIFEFPSRENESFENINDLRVNLVSKLCAKIAANQYDIIVAHSLGACWAALALKKFSKHPKLVLVNPVMFGFNKSRILFNSEKINTGLLKLYKTKWIKNLIDKRVISKDETYCDQIKLSEHDIRAQSKLLKLGAAGVSTFVPESDVHIIKGHFDKLCNLNKTLDRIWYPSVSVAVVEYDHVIPLKVIENYIKHKV